MSELKFFKYLAGGLLLLNLIMLGFFFLTKPGPPKHKRPVRERAVRFMKLDKGQHQAFLQFANEHMALMDGFSNEQRNLLRPYFISILDAAKTIDTDTLLAQIQSIERKKIESTYQHFLDVKSILRPDQYAGFEQFMTAALEFILLDQENNRPPPKDF